MRAMIVSSAFLLAIATTPRVRADDGDEARAKELFERATQQLDQGELAGAIDDYRAAYDLAPRAKILFNIGAVLLELGRKVEAANALADYLLRDDIDGQRAHVVREQLAALDRELGQVSIEIGAKGYRALIDNGVLGTTPLQLVRRVSPGEHVVVLARGDGSSREYPLSVVAGSVHHLVVTPEDVVETSDARAAPADSADTLAPRTVGAVLTDSDRAGVPANTPSLARQPWLWSAIVGAGAATAGVIFGLDARSLEADVERLNANSGMHAFAEAKELKDRAMSRALLANISFAVAGFAAVTSAVLLVRERGRSREPRLRASAGPIRHGGAFVVEVVF